MKNRMMAAVSAVGLLAMSMVLITDVAVAAPSIVHPDHVFTAINTPVPFTLGVPDPISGDDRGIVTTAVDGAVPCDIGSDPLDGVTTGDCVFAQIDTVRGTSNLTLGGTELKNGTLGSVNFNIGGSADAVAAAIATLVYTPDNDYETSDALPASVKVDLQDGLLESIDITVDVHVEGINDAPQLTMPPDKTGVAPTDTVQFTDVSGNGFVELDDPDAEQDDTFDYLLAVVWVTGGGSIYTNGSASCTGAPGDLLEEACTLLGYPLPVEFLPGGVPGGLLFGSTSSSPTEAFAAAGDLAGMQDMLGRLAYEAPASGDADATVWVAVSDLGNNGMPTPIPFPIDGEYVPIPLFDLDSWDIEVRDTDNDPPVLTVPGAQTVDVNLSIPIPSSVADPDSDPGDLSLTLSASGGTVNVADQTGTQAELNAALSGLTFTAGSVGGPGSVTLSVNDQGNTGAGGPMSDTDSIVIDIVDPNAPTTTTIQSPTTTTTSTTIQSPTTTTTSTTIQSTTTTTSTTVPPSTTTTSTTIQLPTTTTTSTTVPPSTTTTSTTIQSPTTTTTSTTIAPSSTTGDPTSSTSEDPEDTTTTTADPEATTTTADVGGAGLTSTSAPSGVLGTGQEQGPLPVTGGEALRLLQLGTAMVLVGLGIGILSSRRRHAVDEV